MLTVLNFLQQSGAISPIHAVFDWDIPIYVDFVDFTMEIYRIEREII